MRVQLPEKIGSELSRLVLQSRSSSPPPTHVSGPLRPKEGEHNNKSFVLLGSVLGACIVTAGLFGITRLPTTLEAAPSRSSKAESTDTLPKSDAATEISSQIHFFEDSN